MTTIWRNHKNGSEAAMKYFIIGSVASALMLYGISLLYGATGSFDFIEIARSITVHPHNKLLAFALVFILAGVGFKLAAFPFHMWAPDVYEGAPTAVTLFLSAAPKIAAVGMTIRILTFALHDLVVIWHDMLMIMAIASIVVGNLLAIVQKNIKRLLAYSTISHMGYAFVRIISSKYFWIRSSFILWFGIWFDVSWCIRLTRISVPLRVGVRMGHRFKWFK